MDIDVQGVRMAFSNGLTAANRLFVNPPSLEILRQRLEKRGLDSEETIKRRLSNATKEIELAHSFNLFHVFITNYKLDEFLQDCSKIIEEWYPFIKN